jgi:hypothetical protein
MFVASGVCNGGWEGDGWLFGRLGVEFGDCWLTEGVMMDGKGWIFGMHCCLGGSTG